MSKSKEKKASKPEAPSSEPAKAPEAPAATPAAPEASEASPAAASAGESKPEAPAAADASDAPSQEPAGAHTMKGKCAAKLAAWSEAPKPMGSPAAAREAAGSKPDGLGGKKRTEPATPGFKKPKSEG
jgi:hypothetical protein